MKEGMGVMLVYVVFFFIILGAFGGVRPGGVEVL
jgi:hypothetical protein